MKFKGALQVSQKVPDGVLFFNTTRFRWSEDRLVGRGTDSQVIAQRIEEQEEIALMREYDYAVVNDEVAAERVKRIIETEHFRVGVIGRYDK